MSPVESPRRRPPPGLEDLAALSLHLETRSCEQILRWGWETFGPRIALSSSFQSQSVPLLHMVSRVAPEMPVLFLDTGFHFQETLAFRDRLVDLLGLRLRVLAPRLGHQGFRQQHGLLYRSDPESCCHLNKVEPMQRAQQELAAWVSGIRRDQTAQRRAVAVVSRLDSGVYKLCPMAGWTSSQVDDYIRAHGLPRHPLSAQGYKSIGCAPCTRAVAAGEDERAGRWSDSEKTECGLHRQPARGEEPG